MYQTCGKAGDTTLPPPIHSPPEQSSMCISNEWHTVGAQPEACEDIALFLLVNPSLRTEYVAYTSKLAGGNAYCTGPTYGWDNADELSE